MLPVISLELRSLPPPQFSLKLAFLHKLLKFKFLPQDTLLNIFSPQRVGLAIYMLFPLLINPYSMISPNKSNHAASVTLKILWVAASVLEVGL